MLPDELGLADDHGLDFNVRAWFAVQVGAPPSAIRVAVAQATNDGGWEFGVERAGQPIGAVLVSPPERVGATAPTRWVVATWGADRSATMQIDAEREITWA